MKNKNTKKHNQEEQFPIKPLPPKETTSKAHYFGKLILFCLIVSMTLVTLYMGVNYRQVLGQVPGEDSTILKVYNFVKNGGTWDVRTNVSNIQTRIGVPSGSSTITSITTAINTTVGTINTTVNSINTSVSSIASTVNSIWSKVDTEVSDALWYAQNSYWKVDTEVQTLIDQNNKILGQNKWSPECTTGTHSFDSNGDCLRDGRNHILGRVFGVGATEAAQNTALCTNINNMLTSRWADLTSGGIEPRGATIRLIPANLINDPWQSCASGSCTHWKGAFAEGTLNSGHLSLFDDGFINDTGHADFGLGIVVFEVDSSGPSCHGGLSTAYNCGGTSAPSGNDGKCLITVEF